MAGELDDRLWASVEKMMIMSSSPYIFFLPTTSASMPNPTWPLTVPVDVATLIAVSLASGILPPK